MIFSDWFLDHLAKKDVELCMPVTAGDGSMIHIYDVISYIIAELSEEDQLALRDKLVEIDLGGGNIARFLKYLAKGLNSSHGLQDIIDVVVLEKKQ